MHRPVQSRRHGCAASGTAGRESLSFRLGWRFYSPVRFHRRAGGQISGQSALRVEARLPQQLAFTGLEGMLDGGSSEPAPRTGGPLDFVSLMPALRASRISSVEALRTE